jgi:hypothetical protein
MKKYIVFLIFISMMVSFGSCFPQGYNQSRKQYKTMKKFTRKKRGKFVPIKKRTHYAHPAIKKDGKRTVKQKFREDRVTRDNY